MTDKASDNSPLFHHRQLAPAAAVRVSPLCLGTMTFGGRQQGRYGDCTREDAFAMLDHFYEQGGNFLDTASGYQEGESEVLVGEWMAARQNRDQTQQSVYDGQMYAAPVDHQQYKHFQRLVHRLVG